MRLQADFENFRRRNAAEREQLSTFVTADVVGKFLKVLDNFERAEQSVKTTNDMSAIVAGMEKIKRQFEQAFKELEVEEKSLKLKKSPQRGRNLTRNCTKP